jgi:hypothetical protein
MRDSKSQAQGVGFDFGTSPHGLSAGHPRTYRKPRRADGLRFLGDGFSAAAGAAGGALSAQAGAASAAGLPRFHYLELTDREFLHLLSAVEHARNRTRKAIKNGLAVEGDMEGTNSLWQKLQEVRALRELKEYGGWR